MFVVRLDSDIFVLRAVGIDPLFVFSYATTINGTAKHLRAYRYQFSASTLLWSPAAANQSFCVRLRTWHGRTIQNTLALTGSQSSTTVIELMVFWRPLILY